MYDGISKMSFSIIEVANLVISHSQLPQNSSPEPPTFDHCGTLTSALLPINDGGLKIRMTGAFE
jgi:hypothetical protein